MVADNGREFVCPVGSSRGKWAALTTGARLLCSMRKTASARCGRSPRARLWRNSPDHGRGSKAPSFAQADRTSFPTIRTSRPASRKHGGRRCAATMRVKHGGARIAGSSKRTTATGRRRRGATRQPWRGSRGRVDSLIRRTAGRRVRPMSARRGVRRLFGAGTSSNGAKPPPRRPGFSGPSKPSTRRIPPCFAPKRARSPCRQPRRKKFTKQRTRSAGRRCRACQI